ncbi:YaaC family protein [Bacillus massiliigorillae]|uniref:YaaC family protein n=1 Tax=Bacillus massiliigorillae TaxID=1243664 RepID=UPI00039D44DF|nr:YaaC family protein [Bacillus massiliigorillae]
MNYLDEIWSTISLFYSASSTQKYLKSCYEKLLHKDSESLSFQNCPTFIYYLEYAQTYYKQAEIAPLTIKPVLLFYGYIQLLKACLLTVDPNYPSSTSLLAHGVTTRKRKKQQYQFLKDEIKIQKSGLYSHLSEKLFLTKQIEGERIIMNDLLVQIPELYNELLFFNKERSYPLTAITATTYQTTNKILDTLHMSDERLETLLKKSFKLTLDVKEEKQKLYFHINRPFSYNYNHPFRFNLFTQNFHFSLSQNSHCPYLGEILIHYLLLYNLSMIARYETEWWLDLMKTNPNEDFPIIQKFLNVTLYKGPFLISKWLLEENEFIFM